MAARRAARHIVRRRRSETLALYTWGAVAVGSVAAALAMSWSGTHVHHGPDARVAEASAPLAAKPDPAPVARLDNEDGAPAVVLVEDRQLDPTTTASIPASDPPTSSPTAPGQAARPPANDDGPAAGGRPFGALLVSGNRLDQLSAVFDNLKRRAPETFEALEPRFVLIEGEENLTARLLTGPFGDAAAVSRFCQTMQLSFTIECTPAPFMGEPLPRSR